MANTTNFGWETPDDTDLVKDGAAAMRTLGNAIDTSFVDLKGGTTGQMLTKASNTDLDYSWVTPQIGDITAVTAGTGLSGGGTSGDVTLTNTIATTFDAKGDLVVGTGADTFAKLTVGANNTIPIADSAESTGIRWGGGWTTWTPTFTNLTVGNGSYTARYCQIGKTVFVEFKFTMGSTSSMGTIPQISVPVSPALTPGSFTCFLEDSGVKAYYGYVDIAAGKFYPQVGVTNSTYMLIDYVQPTVPFTWGTNDSLSFRAVYEAA